MPLPSPRANYHAKQNVNGVLRRVYSDGTKYYDLSNNKAEITNWWVPGGAVFHMDFINDRGWWNGAAKTVSDLTAIGDGSHTLAWADIGATWTGDLTIVWEVEYAQPNYPGVFGGWYNNNNNYRYFRAVGSISPEWRIWQETAGAPSTPTGFSMQAAGADANDAGFTSYAGINRSIFTMRSNSAEGRAIWSNGEAAIAGGTFGVPAAPTTLHFGRHPASGLREPNVTIRSVTIWTRAMTEAEMRKANNPGQAYPLHLLGDSFLTHGRILMYLKNTLIEAAGDNVSLSQDGIGSKNLEDHLARFLTTSFAWDSTLVFVDGSNELDGVGALVPGGASIAAIDAMVAKLTHRRFLYVQPNPINPIGDSRRTAWDADQAAILAHVGSDRYCAVLAGMQAAGDGSTEDNADIANGLWPRSTRGDSTHLNNAIGMPVFADLIYNKLVANKWLPA